MNRPVRSSGNARLNPCAVEEVCAGRPINASQETPPCPSVLGSRAAGGFPVFRSGEHKLPDPNQEEQRLTLYLSGTLLDLAEAQATRAGVETIQEYCAALLQGDRGRAVPRSGRRDRGEARADGGAPRDRRRPGIPRRVEFPGRPQTCRRRLRRRPFPCHGPSAVARGERCPVFRSRSPSWRSPRRGAEPARRAWSCATPGSRATIRWPSSRACGGASRPGWPRSPSWPRHFNQLESEHRGADMIDRRLAYALHRLAFESQVLHTDAWPGRVRRVDGRDAPRGPGGRGADPLGPGHPLLPRPIRARRTRFDLARLPDGGRLGDGRPASATDRPESRRRAPPDGRSSGSPQGTAIYPQGGGTALDYGGIPRCPGVALDTRALDRVIDYPSADMTITVEAGITLPALRAVLAEQGQRLLVDAPHPDRATLGGIYRDQHERPAAVRGRAAARSDHRRQLRDGRRARWSRGAGGSSRTSPATTSPSS